MPSKRGITVLALCVMAAFPGSAAHAFPLPCTGETLVKVREIPALNGLELGASQDLAERRVDLGYVIKGCFGGGEWVGHLGQDGRYVTLTERQLHLALAAAGLDGLPPVPSYWSSGHNLLASAFWLALLATLWVGLSKAKARLLGAREVPGAPGWGQFVEDQAAAYHAAPSLPAGYKAGATTSLEQDAVGRLVQGGSRPAAFGRRTGR
jgi:hypothetical protein